MPEKDIGNLVLCGCKWYSETKMSSKKKVDKDILLFLLLSLPWCDETVSLLVEAKKSKTYHNYHLYCYRNSDVLDCLSLLTMSSIPKIDFLYLVNKKKASTDKIESYRIWQFVLLLIDSSGINGTSVLAKVVMRMV